MVRKRILQVLLVFLMPVWCFGQLTEDFSDGDFVSNPTWTGDQAKFIVSSGRLKLQAPAATGSAFLSTTSQAVHNASWEFYFQFDFNPSSSNYAKVYLIADQTNLQAPLNGYFVRLGHTSREVSLFRQTGTAETEIIDGLDDRLNQPVVKARIKITRNAAGNWELFTDLGPAGAFSIEGTVTDVTHTSSSFLGLGCIYTSTRSDKFWFDDFVVTGSVVPDTLPPQLQLVSVVDQRHIVLFFSETLEEIAANGEENFRIPSLGIPTSANLQADFRSIELTLAMPLTNGVTYQLQIDNIEDLAGNRMPATIANVLFFQPVRAKEKDVIFSELFPDPTPQIGLPSAEFIEIYNRSQEPFDLKGWTLSDGSSRGILPVQIILPGDYWIITSSSSTSLFANTGKILGLTNFPSLNNAGDVLILKDGDGKTIDSINYTLEWYRDEDKAAGGWTLELIDPNNPCGEQDNWAASVDKTGGSPGLVNSILANKPDLTAPTLLYVVPEGPQRLVIAFSEKLDPSSVLAERFVVDPPVGEFFISFPDVSLRTIRLDLEQSLRLQQAYQMEVRDIQDCSGNWLESASLHFGLPETADSLDIVVNEILFNPRSGGVDFVEFYNASEKFISLKGWKVSNASGQISEAIDLSRTQVQLINPLEYFVLCSDPQVVSLQYPQSELKYFRKGTLPSLPDDEGSIAIMNEAGEIVDQLIYSRDWHSEFLKIDEGVSLERISIGEATQARSNWISASSSVGYASPGFVNSQRRLEKLQEGEVMIIPEIFVAGNGAHEFVQIQYRFDHSGQVANVMILNHAGKTVRTLSSNEILGTDGFFRWDGDQDDGGKAPAGYYLVWFETFRADGVTTTFRKRVILAWR